MRRNALRFALATTTLTMILACAGEPDDDPIVPLLDDVVDADDYVDTLDRGAILADALDYDLAPAGEALDLANAPDGFRLQFDGSDITGAAEDEVPPPSNAYSNAQTAWLAVVAADLVTLSVVAPPALAIHVASQGTVTQVDTNVWYAENTVPVDGRDVTTHLTVAWVAVGWLAEMRISTDDGEYSEDLWFNGFLGVYGFAGWWDFYDDGTLVGVVEWISDGDDAQFGMAVTAGAETGTYLQYVFIDDTALVEAHSGPTGEDSWVFMDVDRSGEVRLPNYNGGDVACWDADFLNVSCE